MIFVARMLINAVAIWLAAAWVSGIDIDDHGKGTGASILIVLFIAAVFTVINMAVKPLLQLLSLPLIILTLGLFLIVINALMLMLTSWITSTTDYGISVDGFWTAVWGSIIISIVNWLLGIFVPVED
ncbi:MAG TPA: phage holin family protein [Aldersonia sp.]